MITFSIPTPLTFYSTPQQDTATASLTEAMQQARRGDVVLFSTGQQVMVTAKTKDSITFTRPQEYKMRLLGGAAYRRWLGSYDEDAPAPFRAKPLRRRKTIWRNFLIPAGTTGAVICQAFAETANSATPPPAA